MEQENEPTFEEQMEPFYVRKLFLKDLKEIKESVEDSRQRIFNLNGYYSLDEVNDSDHIFGKLRDYIANILLLIKEDIENRTKEILEPVKIIK